LALGLLLFAALVFGMPSAADAGIVTYFVNLSGPNEFPVNNSPGVGFAKIDFDDTGHTMHIVMNFSGLGGTTTAAHIHAATPVPFAQSAGVATTTPTFANFPLGVTSGTYDNTLNMLLASSYNPAYVTANGGTPASAEAALLAAAKSGTAYLNVHSSTFSGGEIRGFLSTTAIPEPSSFALIGVLVAGMVGYGRLRRKPVME